ncbi:hypothetical protein [Hymenobacter sp. GOD-10R]|uniref:hypothetical protein n=1 Tax=Hymenobacter sp. GOD-10R TaxID=3093922 RepID=UPI002D76C0C2|nr:hypothetical protein [Hymenobacter sp. GOD-10R]WRQ30522.1 hypothetical protein SD425_09645 [Hymenobacter sp. GOD-10R]
MKSLSLVVVRTALFVCLGLAGTLTACETSKHSFPEKGMPADDPDAAAAQRRREAVNRQVATINEGKVEYTVPRNQLATAFIRLFNDGTVIDKTSVQKVQESKNDKPVYYLVGIGLRNGMYRAMAIPLQSSSDNSLYLSSSAERYILTSVGCTFCSFSFEKNRIVGTTCEENTGGSRCDLIVKEYNEFFIRQ